ncbi:hypothetical protein [Staphylococcus auricularis]|uniref:Uncharacterized protein n=1 Tax=Staphylococcus auricularis TaxID=29379 RepID=A0ABX5IH71_9STAP|nr:hypothetical protein [Staphylococcus auricularis]PTH19821.1 hypothetical protein BU607_00090 [Staphylococcus auricularis]
MLKEQSSSQYLISKLLKEGSELFKFGGRIAKLLFMEDAFNINDKIDISVSRANLGELLRLIPNQYHAKGFDAKRTSYDLNELDVKTLRCVNIYYGPTLIIAIGVYDVIDDEWLFRMDDNIRLPEKYIYYHSLKWDVDYIKPEIVLMYELLDPMVQLLQPPSFREVIDSLSYFQYVLLRTVVGQDCIEAAVEHEKHDDKLK